MKLGKSPLRQLGLALAAALALACTAAPPAFAIADRAGDSPLSARLSQLAKPSVHLASRAEQAKDLSVPRRGPGSLLRVGSRVLVEVRFDSGAAAAVDDLRAAGARIVGVSRRYQTVTVAAKPSGLRRLAGVARVTAITEVLTPIVSGIGGSGPLAATTTPCFGAATSEGDEQLRAALAREEFEVDGSGVEVGILSDSFDRDTFAATDASEDVKTGDLPGVGNPCGLTTPVDVLDDSESEGEDEGRAMAQIVHDLAPGAALSFATAFTGVPEFAANIEALANAGAKAIVDDVTYFEEPFFQEGPIGVAVSNVTSSHDVTYFSAAGNDNLIDGAGREIASWEAPAYRDSLGCPASLLLLSEFFEEEGEPGLNPSHCMDFDPGAGTDRTFGITVSPGAELVVDLQWAEPWEGVETDLDAYLLNSKGEPVSGSIERNISDSQRPFELIGWENETGKATTVQLVVNRFAGSEDPPLKVALLENGGGVTETEYPESGGGDVVGPTIFGHNGAEDAMSVGAVPAPPFFEDEPELYSSRGPVTHYFEPVNGSTAADPLPSAPVEIPKPDVVATDGGANTFFGSCVSHTWRFFGTSAAAPHAAAVAALELQADPLATVEEVKRAQIENAGPVGAFPRPGPAIGGGLVNAAAAVAELEGEPFSEPPIQIGPAAPQNCNLPHPPSFEEEAKKIEAANPPAPETRRRARPRTFFLWHPRKVIGTHGAQAKGLFRFGSNEHGVTFLCRVDGDPFRACPARFSRRFPLGPHVLQVKARDASGATDSTPARYGFRVKHLG
jgi:subtilisin family serine protease